MKLFVKMYAASLALSTEVSLFKDITALCEESKTKMGCTNNNQCTNGGSCVDAATDNSAQMVRMQAGPVELLDETVCKCAPNHYGPSCSASGEVVNEKCDEGFCKNGGINSWAFNELSGCSCIGTQFFGWHCDHDNLELCSYVNYDGMSDWVKSQMNVSDCGECLWHSNCSATNATCVYDKSSAKPNNYCAVPCEDGDAKDHASCIYDDNAGQHVWKCHSGYEDDCTTLKPCEERCMNGAENNCDDMEDADDDCICEGPFEGAFCEKVDQCHPDLCDLVTNDCRADNGEEQCVAKASGDHIFISLSLFCLVSLTELLI